MFDPLGRNGHMDPELTVSNTRIRIFSAVNIFMNSDPRLDPKLFRQSEFGIAGKAGSESDKKLFRIRKNNGTKID
jgi:hypothetical protein